VVASDTNNKQTNLPQSVGANLRVVSRSVCNRRCLRKTA